MKNIYCICFFVSLFGLSFGFCTIQLFQEEFCSASNGVTIPVGGTLRIPEMCLDCSCHSRDSGASSGQASMGCCAYGLHAGVMVPPPGCKFITEADGCTPKLVSMTDESKPCHNK